MYGYTRKSNYSPNMGSYPAKQYTGGAVQLLSARIETLENMLQCVSGISRDNQERIDSLSCKIDDIRQDKVVQKRLAFVEAKRICNDKVKSGRRLDGVYVEGCGDDEQDTGIGNSNNGRASNIKSNKENEEFYPD